MDALAGVRIIDFSWAYAGPYATELLALMGAEVIKVESHKRADICRRQTHPISGEAYGVDDSPYFKDFNMNKLGISLDLKKPAAVELAKRLVATADAVVESFTPGVMSKLGLGYESLKTVKPDIIMLSTSTNGNTGPESRYVGYAPMFNATSGLGEMTGYPDGPPTVMRITIDNVVAHFNAVGLLAALVHRQATGQGQHIDTSSQEAISCLVGDSLMDYTMNHRIQTRAGNRDEEMAPHNCYRCSGEDRWISIAVSSDEEWESFCSAMGNPVWSRDERFSDPRSRWHNQDELDKLIETLTIERRSYDLMHSLQAVGVAAVLSFTSQDLFSDPHLAERGFSQLVERQRTGHYLMVAPPWKMSRTPPRIVRDAPGLGEHNDYVLNTILGLASEEIAALKKQEVLY